LLPIFESKKKTKSQKIYILKKNKKYNSGEKRMSGRPKMVKDWLRKFKN
jgi:hypothetical protein